MADKTDKYPLIHQPLEALVKKLRKEGSESEGEGSNSEEDMGDVHSIDIAVLGDYKYEYQRHSLLSAKYIGLVLLYIQRQLQANHVLQCVYFTSLVVDANGVLVLLKFINQDFAQIDSHNLCRADILSILCGDKSPSQKPKAEEEKAAANEEGKSSKKLQKQNVHVIEETLIPLLHLIYRVSVGQRERIDKNLIQYKAEKIMKRIITNFKSPEIKIVAYKVIMIQVKYMKDK